MCFICLQPVSQGLSFSVNFQTRRLFCSHYRNLSTFTMSSWYTFWAQTISNLRSTQYDLCDKHVLHITKAVNLGNEDITVCMEVRGYEGEIARLDCKNIALDIKISGKTELSFWLCNNQDTSPTSNPGPVTLSGYLESFVPEEELN